MDTRLNLQPGQNGTKALVQKYGDRLIRVRDRYDAATGTRYKTVERIEETRPWHPSGSRESHRMARAADEPVLLRIGYAESALRETVRQRGGRWRPEEKAWVVAYGTAEKLGLIDRIVGDI
ncbi:hypothetical protein [Salinisphaera sp. Q1T1-3]|uniref:hypothetical protein n=1 Tax=Salinisphaera sp. Q1T1-3 TaxID=2321229 RepID=UPI000E752BBC|nr:hypothetical protein [Salinisphaera sp. Q1T1-3]RJS93011.1 hypothetical protein D3260_08900 [Salinisphaera sp. Q1T1-3]